MNYEHFDLTIPKPGEDNPKTHKVSNERFKKAWVDFPQASAERLVELGYGRWVPITAKGSVLVPQQFIYPEQFIFIRLKTHAVKAAHINTLVPTNGPVPNNMVRFAENLITDIWYVHDRFDLIDEEEYDKYCDDYDSEGAVDLVYDYVEPEVVKEIVEAFLKEKEFEGADKPPVVEPEELEKVMEEEFTFVEKVFEKEMEGTMDPIILPDKPAVLQPDPPVGEVEKPKSKTPLTPKKEK